MHGYHILDQKKFEILKQFTKLKRKKALKMQKEKRDRIKVGLDLQLL